MTTDEAARVLRSGGTDGSRVVILTDGQAGSQVWDGEGEHVTVPAFDVEVHDTTGCGDAFHGAYAWALDQGDDLTARIRTASAAAAVLAGLPADARRVPAMQAITALLA